MLVIVMKIHSMEKHEEQQIPQRNLNALVSMLQIFTHTKLMQMVSMVL